MPKICYTVFEPILCFYTNGFKKEKVGICNEKTKISISSLPSDSLAFIGRTAGELTVCAVCALSFAFAQKKIKSREENYMKKRRIQTAYRYVTFLLAIILVFCPFRLL